MRTPPVVFGLEAEFGFGFAYGVVEAGDEFVNFVAGGCKVARYLRLPDKVKSAEVFVCPRSVEHHASECLGRERISEPMVGYDYSSTT